MSWVILSVGCKIIHFRIFLIWLHSAEIMIITGSSSKWNMLRFKIISMFYGSINFRFFSMESISIMRATIHFHSSIIQMFSIFYHLGFFAFLRSITILIWSPSKIGSPTTQIIWFFLSFCVFMLSFFPIVLFTILTFIDKLLWMICFDRVFQFL